MAPSVWAAEDIAGIKSYPDMLARLHGDMTKLDRREVVTNPDQRAYTLLARSDVKLLTGYLKQLWERSSRK